MQLAEHQPRSHWFIECSRKDLPYIPKPDHTTDYQDGIYLVEIKRTLENQIGLRLCGLIVEINLAA